MPDRHRVIRTGPKRVVDKIKAKQFLDLTTAANAIVMHTVTEKSTLTRTILDAGGVLQPDNDGDIDAQLSWSVTIKPNGQRVVDTLVADVILNKAMISEDLLEGSQMFMQNATTGVSMKTADAKIDSKGGRKLDPGDTIVLTVVANESSVLAFFFDCKLFILKA